MWSDIYPVSSEVFVDDGMYLEATGGERAQIAVRLWDHGDELFLDHWAICNMKLILEETWGVGGLLLLGPHVNLLGNSISLHSPKIVGAQN